jgi:hypothetical protein
LLHEVLGTLRRWGFSPPPRDKVHTFAGLKLTFATDPDLKRIGLTLEALGRLRDVADYQLSLSGPFVSASLDVRWNLPSPEHRRNAMINDSFGPSARVISARGSLRKLCRPGDPSACSCESP